MVDTVDASEDGGGEELSAEEAFQRQTEERAIRLGWVPKAQWAGPPEKWTPAEDYLDRIMGNRRQFEHKFEQAERRHQEELTDLRSRVEDGNRVISQMWELQKRTREQGYARARAEVEAELRQAAADGNVEAFDAAKKRERDLEEEQRREQQAIAKKREDGEDDEGRQQRQERRQPETAPGPNDDDQREIEAWKRENPWFNSDRAMTVVAMDADKARTRTGSIREHLDAVRQAVRDAFPHKFGSEGDQDGAEDEPRRSNDRRRAQAQVTAGRRSNADVGRRPASGKRTIADVPAEDRRAFDRLAQQDKDAGRTPITADEWMKYYVFADEETFRP